jgi:hypothetical protein
MGGLGLVAAAAVTLALVSSPPSQDQLRAELRAYTAALRAPTAEAGQVVEEDMKPSLSDLRAGRLDAATFSQRARSWQIAMARARRRVDAISAPAPVRAATPLFDAALDGYAAAARSFELAGAATGAQRATLLDQGVAAARAADGTYDRAAAVVQSALRAAGLPPDAELPDPSPGA